MKYLLLYLFLLFSCRSVKLQKNFENIKKDSTVINNTSSINDSATLIVKKDLQIANPIINYQFNKNGKIIGEQIKGTVLRDTEYLYKTFVKHDTLTQTKTITKTVYKDAVINKNIKSSNESILYIVIVIFLIVVVYLLYIFVKNKTNFLNLKI